MNKAFWVGTALILIGVALNSVGQTAGGTPALVFGGLLYFGAGIAWLMDQM